MYKKKPSGKLRKSTVVMASLCILVLGVVGGTLTYLLTNTDAVANNFEYAYVTCKVEESFDGVTKSNVMVRNTGNIPAYIRAEVIATWKDAQGNVYGKVPVAGEDYTVSFGGGWTSVGGYFYHNSAVEPGALTSVLINTCTEVSGRRPAEGYALSVEIIADAVQSKPDKAVVDAWGYAPAGN